ncbi:Pleckstrin homology domain-containing family G member 1,Pleckstrin homology domain-containing family G [Octopus vulgaris]|uniref:Pleckstrin homology domain-containing family G member 1,Pleckstrin homology domain-containing family G n=1 Tax=Octopus vulgaris TaxID=6645 RepID=A0AA36F469_OCTVU|nr:Pleckstrin homology domain-containing family G member 1,Pleckstrin homology domain-containing family G [Octopus vulgaris]
MDHTNTDLEPMDSQQLQSFFRNSLHWEDYYGSSVDLTRALLSIYDKFLNVNEDDVQQQTETCCTDKGDPESICPEPAMYQSDQQTNPSLLSSSSSSSPPPPPPTSSLAAAAAVDEQQNDKPDFDQTDAAASHTTNLCAGATLDNAALDSRKRPLSISSMSSASSSSLPRHSRYKRLNMTDTEIVVNGNNQNIVSGPTIVVDNTDMESVVSSEDFIDTVSVTSSFDGAVRGFEEDRTSASDQSASCQKLTIDQHEGIEEEEDSMTSSSYSSPSHAQDDNRLKYRSNEREKSCSPVPTLHELTDNECKQSLPDEDGEEVTDIHSTSLSHYVSYTERVVSEIVETERTYVKSLKEIKEGYLEYLDKCDDMSKNELNSLFGNIVEIYTFSQEFLEELEHSNGEPLKVAECFVKNKDKFVIYGNYCTNYPCAVETLTNCMSHQNLADIFKQRQLILNHVLPLGAYLLKPVQRVLKYHLLLQNILKHYDEERIGHNVLCQALTHMTSMAQHINEMKRKHEHAVHVQEIQSQLLEYDGADLTTLGDLVLEGSFRLCGTKTYRHVFLFEKAVLIAKKKEEGMLSCKTFIECANLMLIESIPKEPLSFQVIPFDNPKSMHTLQARNIDQKVKWCKEIKHLILESYKGKIPEKVRHLVMELGRSKDEQYVANNENVDPGKRHAISGPDYLEKRGRVRRKSSNLIPDFTLLKPQRLRKGYRRSDPGFLRLIFPSDNKQWNDTEGTESEDDKTGTLINRRRGQTNVTPTVDPDSVFDDKYASNNSLPRKDSDTYKRAMSFRIANIENPINIPDPPKDELAENTELLSSVQSTPARLHSQSSVTSEQPSEDGETELNTKYSSMPSLSERRHRLLHGSDASSVQSLVQTCQQTQGKCDKGPSTSAKAATNQGKQIKKSFKNVLPLLRQAKRSGLLPNIPFKQVQETGGKTRRSSDPPKSQADPWIKKSIQPSCSQIEVSTYSNRRSQLESPNYKNLSRESLDWLVYLNRSSLPPNKYLPSVLKGQNGSQSSYQDMPRYATFPRGMSSPAEMSKSYSQQSVEDNDISFMSGSVSAPLIRRMSYQHDLIPPTSPEQIAESERMLKEMEDYMRKENNDSKMAKFPMQAVSSAPDNSDKDDVPQQTLSRQASQSSILSDSSHSSYESNLGSNESLVSRIQSFPARVASWKAAMAKNPPVVSTSPSFPSKKLVSSISLPSSPLPQDDNVSFSHYFDSDKNHCPSPPPYLETRISCSSPTDGSVFRNSASPLTFYPPSPRISNASASLRSSPVFDSSSTSSTAEKAAEAATSYPRKSLTHLAPSYTWSGAYNRHMFAEPYRSPIKKHCVTNSPPPRRKMGSALVLPIFSSPTIRRSPSPQPSNSGTIEPLIEVPSPQNDEEFDESVEDTLSSTTETETPTISQTTVIAEENEPLSADSCDSPTENSVEEHPVTSPISNPPNETLEEKVDHSANDQFSSKPSNTPLPPAILQDSNAPIKDDANCFSCKKSDQHKFFSPGSSLPCLSNHSSDSFHLSVPACKSNSSSLSRLNEVDLKRFNSLQNCSAMNFDRQVKHPNLKLERNLSLASLLDSQHDLKNQRNQRKKYERWNSLNALHNPTSLNTPDISLWQRQEQDDVFEKSSGSHGNLNDMSGKELKRDLCLTPSDSALSMQSENLGQVSKNQDHFSINRHSTSECSSLSLDTLDSTDMCRDSAIYCDIELEASPVLECPLPPKSSIKEYVQYLEEKNKTDSSPRVKGMKKRAPSQMIRQRLHSLQENSKYKTSRAKKEPEEFKELSKCHC